MFVVISKFMVDNRNGMTESVKKAFIARLHNVDKIAGFVRMEVLNPVENPDEIWVVTYWTEQSSFDAWHESQHYKDSHTAIPAGLKLMPNKTEMMFFNHISC